MYMCQVNQSCVSQVIMFFHQIPHTEYLGTVSVTQALLTLGMY